MLLDLMSNVAREIEVRLDTVSDRSKEMSWSFERVVSVYDDTSYILTTIFREEERASISAGQSPTVALRSVIIIPCEACDGARDKTLRTKDYLIDIA